MNKGGKYFLLKVCGVLFWFVVINVGFFYYLNSSSISLDSFGQISQLTGNSVKQVVFDTVERLNLTQRLILIGQAFLFILIIGFVVVAEIKHASRKKEILEGDVKRFSKKYSTDLDILYSILKNKKKVHLSSISNAFDVDEATAMDWGKTLEASKLAVIDYPVFGEASLKIVSESNSNDNSKDRRPENLGNIKKGSEKKLKDVNKRISESESEKKGNPKKENIAKFAAKSINDKKNFGKSMKKEVKSIKKDIKENISGKDKKDMKVRRVKKVNLKKTTKKSTSKKSKIKTVKKKRSKR